MKCRLSALGQCTKFEGRRSFTPITVKLDGSYTVLPGVVVYLALSALTGSRPSCSANFRECKLHGVGNRSRHDCAILLSRGSSSRLGGVSMAVVVRALRRRVLAPRLSVLVSVVSVLACCVLTCLTLETPYVTRETHYFQGTSCPPYNEWPAAECPLPGTACYPGSNCSQFTTGRFSAKHLNFSPDPNRPVKCTDPDTPGGAQNGRWVADDRTCTFHWHGLGETVKCLKQVRLLISGDSILRALFHRLITYIRGFPSIIEHGFWGSAAYVLNGTEDWYLPHSRLPPSRPASPTVEVEFLWSNKNFSVAGIKRKKADVILLGLNYHRLDNLSNIPLVLDEIVRAASPKHMYWVATAYLHQNKTHRNFQAQWIEAVGQRNAIMRAWVKTARVKWPTISFGIIPLDAIATQFARSNDYLHFHCWVPRSNLPKPISSMVSWVADTDSRCQDLAGLNVIQLLLNMICT
jgi:hypothetical protein